MKSYTNDVLPIKVNGTIVKHKMELKDYRLGPKHGGNNRTLYTVYQAMMINRSNDSLPANCSFADYLDIYCKSHNINNTYTITSINAKSKDFISLAREIIGDDDNEALIRHVMKVALSNDRDRMKAIEYWLMWVGANKVAETAQDISDEPINIIPG